MESVDRREDPAKTKDDVPQANKNDSVQNFQKFIYELFEENGVLNDLRAYLRGHIVDVIKNAQTGDPPACQKHFKQRLELTYQVLNMLVVEYLLCLEFGYSLSVFVSEIPLANMVFDFAQTLLQSGDGSGYLKLRFSDNDIWSVLNYLGVKCDSVNASNVVDMYKNDEKSPLLLCILKCMPLYHKKTVPLEPVKKSTHSSSESLPSTSNSSDAVDQTRYTKTNGSCQDKCKHYVFCKTCQATMRKFRGKYKRKKETLSKNNKDTGMNPVAGEVWMTNISAMEKALIDEMFQQLKTVYEAEIDLVKKEGEKKIKRSLVSHATQLQKHQDELDEAFKVREEELQRSVQRKKEFLWGLAKALREQHAQMSRAMVAVKNETERLSAKEDSLKTQLIEAESILRKRGEELRSQISSELTILEDHLESMKRERDTIHKERRDLEDHKSEYDNKLSINNDMHDLVKNELSVLKKYLESTKLEPRCVIERSTLTDMCDITSKINIILNNEQDADRSLLRSDSDDRVSRAPNQVVNNLKKQNNVNFSSPHLDVIYQDRVSSNERSRPIPGEVGDVREGRRDGRRMDRTVQQLREENDRLKSFARQQRLHIDDLGQNQARLQSELTAAYLHADSTFVRPRTAPSVLSQSNLFAESTNCFGWRKGAGEELSTFSNAQPRILVPGDALPFVGVQGDRQTDYRRHMISQWRSLRRRVTPLAGARGRPLRVAARQHRPPVDDSHGTIQQREINIHTELTLSAPAPSQALEEESIRERSEVNIKQPECSLSNGNTNKPHTVVSDDMKTTRDKSPKSLLREAKQKLRNKDTLVKNLPHTINREKSPNSVLREAKLRLRKLEIEAEAVEKSYLDFKKRHTERREGHNHTYHVDNIELDVRQLDMKLNSSLQKLKENRPLETGVHLNYASMGEQQSLKNDFEKYIRNYQTKFKFTETPSAKISLEKAKSIPGTYSKIDKPDENIRVQNNYLETPLVEFRKLYHSQQTSVTFRKIERTSYPNTENGESPRNLKSNAGNEQALLKDICSENIEQPWSNENKARSYQDLPKTVYPEHLDSERNDENNTLNSEKLTCSYAYPEVEAKRNCENANNELDIYDSGNKAVMESGKDTLIKDKEGELDILKDKLSKLYNLHDHPLATKSEQITSIENIYNSEDNEPIEATEENNLIIEVESVSKSNNLKITEPHPQEIVLEVQSSMETRISLVSDMEEKEEISTRMTIPVSPKSFSPRGGNAQSPKKSTSPCSIEMTIENQQSNLIQNEVLDDIFQSDPNKQIISSGDMQLEISKEGIEEYISDNDKVDDDFSADVDNYNSQSDYENNSPISLPKTSEDENFWDS